VVLLFQERLFELLGVALCGSNCPVLVRCVGVDAEYHLGVTVCEARTLLELRLEIVEGSSVLVIPA